MKHTIDIEYPEDFRLLCEIFCFRPEDVIQKFADQVSLPRYFGAPEDKHRWANLFFLDYLENVTSQRKILQQIDWKFYDKIQKKIAATKSKKKQEEICREILIAWNKEIQRAMRTLNRSQAKRK